MIDLSPALKSFPLADILSLARGVALPGADVHELVGFIAGVEPHAGNTALHAKDARACLVAQLPFLRHMECGLPRMDARMWMQAQARLLGAEHYVMPLARWRRRAGAHRL